MTIPASDIVNIVPNVLSAGGNPLALNGVFLTTSTRVPIGQVLSFPSQLSVAAYFGSSSNEAKYAATYFLGFDNSNIKPYALLFAQYPINSVSAYLRGGSLASVALATLKTYTGVLSLTIDGYAWTSAAINLSGATSFSGAAGLIQTALQSSPPVAAVVTGAISGTTLTVSAVTSGVLAAGQVVSGTGITLGTQITALISGTGGTGTYAVSVSQSASSTTVTASGMVPTVVFDSVSSAFVITSGISGAPSTISVASGSISANLALTTATGAALSQGAVAATPAAFMDSVINQTQNWATFTTLFDPDSGSGNTIKLAFAAWVNNQNNRYLYAAWDTDITPTESTSATGSLGALLISGSFSGTSAIYATDTVSAITLAAFLCGAVASIDFTEINGRATLDFRTQSGITPTVTDQLTASNLRANGYNFYGSWATANDLFKFFNPGSVSGQFMWIDSYVNQIWLRNQLQLAFMTLLTVDKSVAYNTSGYNKIRAAALDPINQGLNFGAIRTGVSLSALQASEVNSAAGVKIDQTLTTAGYYFQVLDATAQTRAQRKSPSIKLWYMDGQSVQQISMAAILVQ